MSLVWSANIYAKSGHLQVRESVRSGVKDIIKRVGVTAVLVTHDQEEAFDIADRVVVFNRSATRQWGLCLATTSFFMCAEIVDVSGQRHVGLESAPTALLLLWTTVVA